MDSLYLGLVAHSPIEFEAADGLSCWSAKISGKVFAKTDALTGLMTPAAKRVQIINAPGSEVGPGTVAILGKAVTNKVDAMGFKGESNGMMGQANISHLI